MNRQPCFLVIVGLLACGRIGEMGRRAPDGSTGGREGPDVGSASDGLVAPTPPEPGADASTPDAGVAPVGRRPTTKVVFRGNLYPGELHRWEDTDPSATCNFSFSLDIIDRSGAAVWMPVLFVRESGWPARSAGAWSYHAKVGGAGLPPGLSYALLEGSLVFDDQGRLAEARQKTTDVPLKDGDVQTILLDFGTGTAQGGNGDGAVTSTARESFMTVLTRQPEP